MKFGINTSASNQAAMKRFLDNDYHVVAGEYVLWKEFVADFLLLLKPADRDYWNEVTLRKNLPSSCPVGRGPGNRKIVGNLSKIRQQSRRWIKDGNRVRLEP